MGNPTLSASGEDRGAREAPLRRDWTTCVMEPKSKRSDAVCEQEPSGQRAIDRVLLVDPDWASRGGQQAERRQSASRCAPESAVELEQYPRE